MIALYKSACLRLSLSCSVKFWLKARFVIYNLLVKGYSMLNLQVSKEVINRSFLLFFDPQCVAEVYKVVSKDKRL